jgi:hypothetical protein
MAVQRHDRMAAQRHDRMAACEDERVELALLHGLAAERRARWESAEFTWEVVDGPPTDKPAAWLVLHGPQGSGQLTVWVSGEAELDWGTPTLGGERHYDLDSPESLAACVTDLEREMGLV